ncbi:MAG: L-serine ammonia-lyase [Pseudomonadota bacterium]
MISVFDLFSIGIGPSSSHTVGPMRAARKFAEKITHSDLLNKTHYITVEVYGSLAFTGKGHGTDKAILMGLEGEDPEFINPDSVDERMRNIDESHTLFLNQTKKITFNPALHLILNLETLLPKHSNGMSFKAFDAESNLLVHDIYYSIGGGFIITEDEADVGAAGGRPSANEDITSCPYPFNNTEELMAQCRKHHLTIAELMMANESFMHGEENVRARLLKVYTAMHACIEKGCQTGGILPGGLNVKRRAKNLHELLMKKGKPTSFEHIDSMSWLNLFAIAVNEENAAGGRVVTAPTNGAAGIIPAVLHYYLTFYTHTNGEEKIIEFLLTAAAITILFKKNASISGAEVGCQGEVGVASSMAAGALTAVLDGTLAQVENAAEIAIEHHLGMTCDPVGGLVQIPCIERNAMGSWKAVNAMRLSMEGDGTHKISLDQAILTMKKTGEDMNHIYKETSLGGLAASYIEC